MLSEVQDDYDVFVCYDELTSSEYAETIYKALTRKGYKVFVAHLRRPYITGNFRDMIDRVIGNCKIFALILNYETLLSDEVKREVKVAFPNGHIPNQNDFWIFHENLPDVLRGSPEFTNETGIQLESLNQNNFSMRGQLGADALRKCNERRNSQNIQYTSLFPPKKDPVEENLIQFFAAQYEKKGYKADFQSPTWRNFYVDLVLRKDNEMILCEFKKKASFVKTSTFRQLLTFKSEIENIEPSTKTKLWLIVNDSFDSQTRVDAKNLGIELFDENNLEKGNISVSTDRTVYPHNSVIHLRIKPEIIIADSPIFIQILDSKQKVVFEDKIPVKADKIFQEYDIPLRDSFSSVGQEYYVKVKHGLSEAFDSFSIQARNSIIQLDQKIYTWTDQVVITVISPDSDKDNQKIETIGNKPDSRITVRTSKGELIDYVLHETGESTGIFQGLITLTGFKNNFLKYDHLPNFGITSGTGPNDGLLACGNNDMLEITFENETEIVVGKALVRWNIGEIQWLEPSYSINDQAVIRVIDPDMNLDPYFLDEIIIHVWSDSDSKGIQLKVKETSGSSAIFHGTVKLTEAESRDNLLHVSNGDSITAEYVDHTLPEPYQVGNKLTIASTAIVGEQIPPLERIKLKNPRILNEKGNQLTSVSKGQKVQIVCDLTNLSNYDQSFTYFVSIKDLDNITLGPSWIIGTIKKDQSITSALSWIPKRAGKYLVTIYVWKGVDNPEALTKPLTFEVQVIT